MIGKEWKQVTEQDLKRTVMHIMETYGENGKDTNYSHVLKMSLRVIVRFVETGSRNKPEDGEVKNVKFLKLRPPKDKLTREDLPTDEEIQKILDACANSTRDKAMFSVHAEAGTRAGELLGMRIKDVTVDGWGAIIKVDGKTGVRPIRIVKSVSYLIKWINAHPFREDLEHPLWIYIDQNTTFGNPINYAGLNCILQKRIRQAGIKKRITLHLFRHKEITDMASDLTEAESRMRHGWSDSSLMPAKYTHLNQEGLDKKVLRIMGVQKPEETKESLRECVYCKMRYPLGVKFCETCSRPLDVTDAIRMEKEHEDKMKSMMNEMFRQEYANKSVENVNEQLEKENLEQQKEIKTLKEIILKSGVQK